MSVSLIASRRLFHGGRGSGLPILSGLYLGKFLLTNRGSLVDIAYLQQGRAEFGFANRFRARELLHYGLWTSSFLSSRANNSLPAATNSRSCL